jgi:hypothetical protein
VPPVHPQASGAASGRPAGRISRCRISDTPALFVHDLRLEVFLRQPRAPFRPPQSDNQGILQSASNNDAQQQVRAQRDPPAGRLRSSSRSASAARLWLHAGQNSRASGADLTNGPSSTAGRASGRTD